jgi:ATP-dependent Clp protease ATP-binding subunit ClpA
VLESLDVTVEEVRAQVARIVGQGDEVTTGQIPFTPRAKKVLELSLREALGLGHNYIGTEHILLGVVRENEGVAARILLDFDADAEKIRNEIIRMLSGPRAAELELEVPEDYSPESPPVPPEVVAALERVRQDKEAALAAQQFEKAASMRDLERRIARAAVRFERGWRDGEPVEDKSGGRASPPRLKVGRLRPLPRRVSNYDERATGPLVLGWALFGVALGVGLLLGRLIWG